MLAYVVLACPDEFTSHVRVLVLRREYCGGRGAKSCRVEFVSADLLEFGVAAGCVVDGALEPFVTRRT